MAMKQTQTKLFDFSDAGLDFSPGSKNLFPDRFKKILALGFNEQTVASVSVSDNQVTLEYGVTHGYVAERVLKVNSGPLASINGGEFWIDSVTATSVTMTIDTAPSSIAGMFSTKSASLGWSLEYENANIHIYKFKHIDDSDRYIRLCFQNNANYRNRIAPCVGRSFDPLTGFITDDLALADTKEASTPNTYAWEFVYRTGTTFDNYTYAEGLSTFGQSVIVGSLYHLVFMFSKDFDSWFVQGVFPTTGFFDLAAILCDSYGNPNSTNSYGQSFSGKIMLGNNICVAKHTTVNETTNNLDVYPQAIDSVLPNTIESFNTTTTELMSAYLQGNGQHMGYLMGIYRCKYAANGAPPISKSGTPTKTMDVDLSSIVYIQPITSSATNTAYATYYAIPVEEIKID